MITNNKLLSRISDRDIKSVAVFFSVLISIWILATNDTIALDGVLYVDVAAQIQEGNYAEAYRMYQWPFYPALLAVISKFTFIGIEHVAYGLNILFFSAMTWAFISILEELNASRGVLIAGLILITVHPNINEYRADILRGPPFWALFLFMLLIFIKLQSTRMPRYGIIYSLVACISALFRVEGIFYLLLLPLLLLLGPIMEVRARLRLIAYCYVIPFVAFLGALSLLLLVGMDFPGRSISQPLSYYEAIFITIPQKGALLMQQVLTPKAEDYGIIVIYSALLTIMIASIVARTTIIVSALGAYSSLSKKININQGITRLFLAVIIINCSYLWMHMLVKYFVSGRYAMPSLFVLMLLASYSLAYLFSIDKTPAVTLFRSVVVLSLVILLLDGLISTGPSKNYIKESGHWLEKNTSPNQNVLSSHMLIRHYAGIRHNSNERKSSREFAEGLADGRVVARDIMAVDYVALRDKHISNETIDRIESLLGSPPIKIFSNTQGRRVLIYKNQAKEAHDLPSAGLEAQ